MEARAAHHCLTRNNPGLHPWFQTRPPEPAAEGPGFLRNQPLGGYRRHSARNSHGAMTATTIH